MMRASKSMIASAAVLTTALAGVAIAGNAPGDRFAQGSDRGQNPVASAAGNISDPKVIYGVVKTIPSGQKVGAKWTTDCGKGPRTGTRGDTFLATAPVVKKLRMRFDDPDICHATILARMKGNGTIKVALRAKTR